MASGAEAAERAVEIVPDCGMYRMAEGLSHYRLGRYDEAMAALGAAENNLPYRYWAPLSLDPKAAVYGIMAMTLHAQGKRSEASQCLAKAQERLREQPSHGSDYVSRLNSRRIIREAEQLLNQASSED